MSSYFTRERFGRPQFLAGLLLFAFLAQTLWLLNSELRGYTVPDAAEAVRIREGWKQWHGRGFAGAPFSSLSAVMAGNSMAAPAQPPRASYPGEDRDGYDTEHSPLLSLVTSAPLLVWPERWLDVDSFHVWRWLVRLPFLACGLALGASLWYVARRLCGNTGGFIALTLFCFSPGMIQAAAVRHTDPDIVTAWGAFGAIFTAIAVAHTLYAPREVVLWNWRRIVLLGVSLAIAVGSQFSMNVLVPLALAFLLYVAPVRRKAGSVIWSAACLTGMCLFFAFYFFHPHAWWQGLRHAVFWGATWRSFAIPQVYTQTVIHIARDCPAFAIAFPVAAIAYAAWPRTRYFGNTAPFLVAVLFILLGMAHPHSEGAGFFLASVPFLFMFVSGVLADLMETKHHALISAAVLGLLLAYALWNLFALTRVS
jgi:hypothetical protein